MDGEEAAENAGHGCDLDRLQEPWSHMLSEGDEWIRVLEERGHLVGVVEAVSGGERVHHEHVEHPYGAKRAGDRERDAAPGLRVSSPSVAAASNPMKDRSPKTTPSPTPVKPVGEADGRNT